MGKITNFLLVLSNLLGTIFCGIGAYFGAAIYYGWKPTGQPPLVYKGTGAATIGTGAPSMNPYWPLIIFGVLGIILLASTWIFIFKIMDKGKLPRIAAPPWSGPVSPPPPILSMSKKYYSDRNKSNLADALTDLLEILNRDGSRIIQEAERIIAAWGLPTIANIGRKPPEVATSIEQLNALGNLAANFYRDLFEDNSFIKKYQAYTEELCQILEVHEKVSNTPNQPIIELQSGINFFRNILIPIQPAEKHNDKNLTSWIMANTTWPYNNFQHKVNAFRTWIDNTKKQITAFRNAHLS